MAARKPISPFLTLPESSIAGDPPTGWEFLREGAAPEVVVSGQLFPSWDSALKFGLRRRLRVDVNAVAETLGLSRERSRLAVFTRLETGRGLFSQVVDRREIDLEEGEIEVVIWPDSSRMSRDISLISTLVLVSEAGTSNELAPSRKGSKIWESSWASKLEGGRTRLPMETIPFSSGLKGIAGSNALFQVVVADYPDLEFEQAVCVYLNADFPAFVGALERDDPAATTMLWDGVVRQLVAHGLTTAFSDERESWPEGSVGFQIRAWLRSIFPGQTAVSIAATRVEDPGGFEARIQSWVRAGPTWSGAAK